MSTTESYSLNQRFRIPRRVTFGQGPGGLTVVDLASPAGTARIALQGAQLLSWAPRDAQPVIWLSPAAKFVTGKSIRGGVPVCWPWFGPHARKAGFPGHGFARTMPWEVLGTEAPADGATTVSLRLLQDAATRAQWPYPAELDIHVKIGQALQIELVTRNTGPQPVGIGEALHTYFRVGDVTRVTVEGLAGCPYLDKVDGGSRKQQVGPVTISGETDRIYLGTQADCVIDDPVLERRIRISKWGSASTVVWNPWLEKADRMGDLGEDGFLHMLCVESANAADDAVEVVPGTEHRLGVCCSVEERD